MRLIIISIFMANLLYSCRSRNDVPKVDVTDEQQKADANIDPDKDKKPVVDAPIPAPAPTNELPKIAVSLGLNPKATCDSFISAELVPGAQTSAALTLNNFAVSASARLNDSNTASCLVPFTTKIPKGYQLSIVLENNPVIQGKGQMQVDDIFMSQFNVLASEIDGSIILSSIEYGADFGGTISPDTDFIRTVTPLRTKAFDCQVKDMSLDLIIQITMNVKTGASGIAPRMLISKLPKAIFSIIKCPA